ncbi:serine threonine kinase [Fusarium sp. NRRL 52700]|nr:serine threonine kinase [Fusarium sp. NRRL 52700]
MDSYDLLVECCRLWATYPCNLQRPSRKRYLLEALHTQFKDSKARLFDSDLENICFVEPSEGVKKYSEEVIGCPSDLQTHLFQNRKDPYYCIIFINSEDSRSPLNCSHESFSLLGSFYQIPESFLDLVSAFGFTREPKSYHTTGFDSFDTLDEPKGSTLEILRLGRSGRDHVVQYLLRAIEKSTGPKKETTWNIRQMAVHHRYDFVTGKSFWISMKSNGLMEERTKQAISEDPALRPTAGDGLPRSFAATLQMHLMHLDWCDESWQECITDFEKKIRSVLTKAKAASLNHSTDSSEVPLMKALRRNTHITETDVSEKKTASGLKYWLGLRKGLMPCFRAGGQKRAAPPHLLPVVAEKSMVPPANLADDFSKKLYSLMVLGTFSFEEVQHLHHLGEQLENLRVVLQLDRQTLRDVTDHYQDLASRDCFAADMMKACKRDVASFTRRVERIQKNLEIRLTQIESMMAWLQEGKTLFDGILQYRSVQVSHVFTESSHIQSEKMERIAHKTEQETISMHVVTFVTLAFLPGTFVAAFFQSGLVEVNKASDDVRGSVVFYTGAFKLFSVICLPLMFITFALWFMLYKILARRAQRREMEESV